MWVRWRLWMVCRSSACPPQRCLHLGMLHGVALPKGSKVFLNNMSVLIKKCMPAVAVLAFLGSARPPWRCLHPACLPPQTCILVLRLTSQAQRFFDRQVLALWRQASEGLCLSRALLGAVRRFPRRRGVVGTFVHDYRGDVR